ncbi:MAG: HNH endonuclease [Phycicoccus sp.]|nr:HNH endonuclease [Phycicoccus sp.]
MDRGITPDRHAAPGAAVIADLLTRLATVEIAADDDRGLVDVVAWCEQLKGAAAAVQARATVQFLDRRVAAAEAAVGGIDECRPPQADHSGRTAQTDRPRRAARAPRGDRSRRVARADRSARAELALARRCSPAVMDRQVGVAKALVAEMPATMGLLTTGQISEGQAFAMVARTACLTLEDRASVDALLAADLPGLSARATHGAAERAAAEADNAAVALRHAAAVASRRVSTRPAPDGMAYLTVLGPLVDVIGAYAALTEAAKARDPRDRRSTSNWLTDTALELLSGRAPGQPQPIEIALVMTDQALLPAAFTGQAPGPACGGDLAHLPGYGVLPAGDVRARITALLDDTGTSTSAADQRQARIWLRRLFTSPDGRDLVAMDSKRRTFTGSLRRFLELRDPTCRVPYCDAPAINLDHATGHAHGASTSAAEGNGHCAHHNQIKEHPGWRYRIINDGLDPGPGHQPHELQITTPTGHEYRTRAAPLHGWGTHPIARTQPTITPGGQAPTGVTAFPIPEHVDVPA